MQQLLVVGVEGRRFSSMQSPRKPLWCCRKQHWYLTALPAAAHSLPGFSGHGFFSPPPGSFGWAPRFYSICQVSWMLIALGTVAPDVPHKQPQHKYVFTLRFVWFTHNSGEPGCACPGPWRSPHRARPAPSAHAATCTPLCWGNPKAGVRDSLPCSVRLSSPLPAPCRPPGLAVWGCNPSPPCFTRDKGCSCSQYHMVLLSCVQWVSAGFRPSPAEGEGPGHRSPVYWTAMVASISSNQRPPHL